MLLQPLTRPFPAYVHNCTASVDDSSSFSSPEPDMTWPMEPRKLMAFMLLSLGSLSKIFTTWGSWVGAPDSSVVMNRSSVAPVDRKRQR